MKKRGYELKELAALTNATLIGDPLHQIEGVADLENAEEGDASFLNHPRYENKAKNSKAGVIFISPNSPRKTTHNYLLVENPAEAFQKVVELVNSDKKETTGFSGIHPSAVIHPSAKIGERVSIGPNAIIDKDAVIEAGTHIGGGCFIGLGTAVGGDCLIHPNVVIKERCTIGNRVIIQAGAVIGLCGYGYIQDKQGRHQKLHHFGTVEIHDDVEIGANTTIARARFYKTVIGEGTKLDSLIEVGHNVHIGRHCIIVGQSAIGGSTKIGDHVMLGGKVAIDSHLEIASGVMIRAYSGVSKSITKPGAYGGVPVQPLSDQNRMDVHLRGIEKTLNRIKGLEKRVSDLERE
jgi:UDP-3-O-[3-hydroxymyristoyl] glucosamine N-acyltransferase